MNIKRNVILASIVGITLGWNSTSFAACAPPQVSGVWEMAFSDGNACRIKLLNNGKISVAKSVCYDPDRGAAAPDSGQLKIQGNCFAKGEIVIEGVAVELPVQFSNDRTTAAGRYRISADGSKGSVVLIRVP
jgi:hypothetical protein